MAREGDRYDELMARHAALSEAVRQRMAQHVDRAREQLPLGGPGSSAGGRTDGIVLGPDGSLTASLTLRDVHGVEEHVLLRADPGGRVEPVVGAGHREPPPPSRGPESSDETGERLLAVTRLAEQHLPAAAAQDFLALLRPALRLEHAGEGDPVIAQLGGLPTLPINSWPVWEGRGPLNHVLTFDCAQVARLLPDLGIPTEGRLGFFFFDREHDGPVAPWEPSTSPGFRVVHLRPDLSTPGHVTDAATPAPPGLTPYPVVALTAVRTVSWPSYETPWAEAVWRRHDLAGPRDGVASDRVHDLYEALWELRGGGYDTHQVGGHPCPQQGPVEMEVEQLRRGRDGTPFAWDDPDARSDASRWRLLLQVASDDAARMMWGDVGQLYYCVTDADRPEDALLTMQCG